MNNRVKAIRQPDGTYEQRYVDICRNCGSKGKILLTIPPKIDICPVCEGSGRVEIVKLIHVSIMPFNCKTNNFLHT
jgi:DnaJ-class molecular chaperone